MDGAAGARSRRLPVPHAAHRGRNPHAPALSPWCNPAQVEKEARAPAMTRAASASKQMHSASSGSFEGSWGWDDSPAAQAHGGTCAPLVLRALVPDTATRGAAGLRSTHSAQDLPSSGGGAGGNYTIQQLNASAAGKDQFFARKMHENAHRCVRMQWLFGRACTTCSRRASSHHLHAHCRAGQKAYLPARAASMSALVLHLWGRRAAAAQTAARCAVCKCLWVLSLHVT